MSSPKPWSVAAVSCAQVGERGRCSRSRRGPRRSAIKIAGGSTPIPTSPRGAQDQTSCCCPPPRTCTAIIDSNAAAQNFGAHGLEMQPQEKKAISKRHDQQRPQHRGIDRRPAKAHDAGRLVQRVPPIDREFDDRNVDDADDGSGSRRRDRRGQDRRTLAKPRSARGRGRTARAPRSAGRPTPNTRPTSACPRASR